MTDIHLTPEELEEIKDDAVFKKLTIFRLKQLSISVEDHIKTSNGFREDVTRLKVHSAIHWVLIFGILGSIIATFAKLILK